MLFTDVSNDFWPVTLHYKRLLYDNSLCQCKSMFCKNCCKGVRVFYYFWVSLTKTSYVCLPDVKRNIMNHFTHWAYYKLTLILVILLKYFLQWMFYPKYTYRPNRWAGWFLFSRKKHRSISLRFIFSQEQTPVRY